MLSRRAQQLKPSPTLALAAKAKEMAAKGLDVISLSVGEPDWPTFQRITDMGVEALHKGQTKYAPANGTPELRKAIAVQTSQDLGVTYAPTQVTVTAGAKFSVFAALQVIVDPGDEVIIPAPYWVSYPTMVELADGKPVIASSSESNFFRMTANELRGAITSKTKALILTSPNNPTGETFTKDELGQLASVLRDYPKIVIISDDIYNRLVFGGEPVAPHILQVAPDLKDRTIIINGASKTYSMTGWRVGWAVGPQPVIDAMTNYQSQTVSCAAPFAMTAALEGLQNGQAEMKKKVNELISRRDTAHAKLTQISGVQASLPGGAFYLWPKVSDHFQKSFNGRKILNSSDFCSAFLESEHVAAVPGVEFGQEGYLRLSYVVAPVKMTEALKRLERFVGQLK